MGITRMAIDSKLTNKVSTIPAMQKKS